MRFFAFLRLKAGSGDWRALHRALTRRLPPERLWGAFHGLFGVGSNELMAITVGDEADVAQSVAVARQLPGATCGMALPLAPTARPTSAAPLRREGLHVLRFFDVAEAHQEEFVALSQAAWETFEAADGYRAQPQGLFSEHGARFGRGAMLLVTWYDGLGSWQASRSPPAAARERFARRGKLAASTVAYATRLIV